nr:hypothetical protein [Tanacetum cinerariifolium]
RDTVQCLAFSRRIFTTFSAGGGGARRDNAIHCVVFVSLSGVFADGSNHRTLCSKRADSLSI